MHKAAVTGVGGGASSGVGAGTPSGMSNAPGAGVGSTNIGGSTSTGITGAALSFERGCRLCNLGRMCNLYTWKMTAEEMRALKLHFQFIGTTWTEWEERQRQRNAPIEDVYPNKRAPVVVMQNGEYVLREDMLWGFPKYKPGANWGTNFRTLKNSQWKPWLDREHRCVVPAMAFAEPDKNTPKGAMMWRWFRRADGLPFFFAGIWRPWTGDRGTRKAPNVGDHTLFSIMTTEPNGVVEPIHEQAMPVLLMTAEDVDRWLKGTSVEDALAMQKRISGDALEVGPPVKPEKKAA